MTEKQFRVAHGTTRYLQLVSSSPRGPPCPSAEPPPAAAWPDEISVGPACSLCPCSACPGKRTARTLVEDSPTNTPQYQRRTGQNRNSCAKPPTDLVFEAGHADSEELQQLVELRGRHLHSPALNQTPVGVLHHPQEAHQQMPAGVGSQGSNGFTLAGRRNGRNVLSFSGNQVTICSVPQVTLKARSHWLASVQLCLHWLGYQ